MNFRTLLPGTFKGNIRIRKLWLHHNPLRWVEQNLIVCLIIFHHMQHFYKCILVFKKSPLCSHLSMLPTLYSSPWPFHHLRPDQNKMMLSIWPLWIRSKKWRKNAIITENSITINVIVPSPLSSPSLALSISSLSTSKYHHQDNSRLYLPNHKPSTKPRSLPLSFEVNLVSTIIFPALYAFHNNN